MPPASRVLHEQERELGAYFGHISYSSDKVSEEQRLAAFVVSRKGVSLTLANE